MKNTETETETVDNMHALNMQVGRHIKRGNSPLEYMT